MSLQSRLSALITLIGADIKGLQEGWINDTAETWTYLSATSFTVPSNLAVKYGPGTKLKFTQSATLKYFVVTAAIHSSGTTTVYLHQNGGSTFTNNAVTLNYHSYIESPQGWPGYNHFAHKDFAGTLVVTGTTAAGASTVISSDPIQLDGATRLLVEVLLPAIDQTPDAFIVLTIWDGSTDLGDFTQLSTVVSGSTTGYSASGVFSRVPIPASSLSAGAHTIHLKAYKPSGTVNAFGSSAGRRPGHIRLLRD